MIALFSVIIILIISVLVTRIATTALMHTGLSKQVAQFQARSAFTGVGFPAQEAEHIVNHPARRKIVMTLMLFGNVGIVSVIASLLLTFVNTGEASTPVIYRILLLAGGISFIWFFFTNPVIDKRLSRIIDKTLARYTNLAIKDYAGLLHLSGDYAISELKVEKNDWLEGKTLKETALREEGVNVLGVKRKDGRYIGAPNGDTMVEPDDLLIVYGRKSVFADIDNRKKNVHGDIQHREMVHRHKTISKKEKEEEERKTFAAIN